MISNRKKCSKCKIEKDISDFSKKVSGKNGYANTCKLCANEYGKKYYQNNKEEIKDINKEYYEAHKEKIKECNKEYRKNNKSQLKEYNKEYYQDNKERLKEYNTEYVNGQRKENKFFRIKRNVSGDINKSLKSRGKSKNAGQTWKNLSYTSEQLMAHIESLFLHPDNLTSNGKVWMTADNQGHYRIDAWDDNNPTTWKWQVDHIKPHHLFDYELGDALFHECWSLENLRPYSAKRNNNDSKFRSQEEIEKIKVDIKEFLKKGTK